MGSPFYPNCPYNKECTHSDDVGCKGTNECYFRGIIGVKEANLSMIQYSLKKSIDFLKNVNIVYNSSKYSIKPNNLDCIVSDLNDMLEEFSIKRQEFKKLIMEGDKDNENS